MAATKVSGLVAVAVMVLSSGRGCLDGRWRAAAGRRGLRGGLGLPRGRPSARCGHGVAAAPCAATPSYRHAGCESVATMAARQRYRAHAGVTGVRGSDGRATILLSWRGDGAVDVGAP